MGENGYRKPRLMQELDVEIWLNDPQDPLEHQIGPPFEEYWRVYAAIKPAPTATPMPRLSLFGRGSGWPKTNEGGRETGSPKTG